jgi:hypothetical protein
LENSRKECEIIHIEVKCGREPVARCARVAISTKCRRECSEEQEKVEEVNLMRESEGKSSRRRIPEVFIKIPEQDSFRQEVNYSRPSDPKETHGGWP